MMKRNHTRLCAGAAIAALALSSTPLLAQVAPAPVPVAPAPTTVAPTPPAESATVPILPEATTPAEPSQQQAPVQPQRQPTLVVPIQVPETLSPVATEVTPEPEAPPAAPDGEAEAPMANSPPAAEAAPPAASSAPEPRASAVAPAEPAPAAIEEDTAPFVTDAMAPIAVSEPTVTSTPPATVRGENTQLWVAVLAGVAAIALAIWGFVAIGRRKPVDRKAALLIERPVVTPRESEMVVETSSVTPLASARAPIATPAPSLAHTGAAVPLPSRMPETFAERDALLKRLIAAKPDRANPFTTYKARLKRARLILQSLGRDFGDRKPWIDLSQYPGNWPELSRRQYAAA